MSIGETFLETCEAHPERRFVHAIERSGKRTEITYGEALWRVRGLVERMADQGLEPGDRVLLYSEDIVPSIFCLLACALRRMTVVPFSPLVSPRVLLDRYVPLVRPKAVFTARDEIDRLVAAGLAELPYLDAASIVEGPRRPSVEVRCESRDADVFMIQPTSGSTGEPKLVVRPHDAFTRYARFVGAELRSHPGPLRFLQVAALTHAFGAHMFTTAVSLGAELCIPSRIDQEVSLEDVVCLDPHVVPTIPRVLRSLHRQHVARTLIAPMAPVFGPSCHTLLSAGGPADPDLLRYLRQRGISPIEFYGSSEASIVALTPAGAWRPGHAGRLVPDVECRRAPDGELLVRSCGVMHGYLGRDRLDRAAFDDDGFYRTGDIAENSVRPYSSIALRASLGAGRQGASMNIDDHHADAAVVWECTSSAKLAEITARRSNGDHG